MTGVSGLCGCGISSQAWMKGLAVSDFENHFRFPSLALLHSCWWICSTLFLPHPPLSWNLLSCFRALSVTVCCAHTHVYITRAFGNCELTSLQVPHAKFICQPKCPTPSSFASKLFPSSMALVYNLREIWYSLSSTKAMRGFTSASMSLEK